MKRMLLKFIKFIFYGIVLPILRFLGTQFHLFYLSQKPKFSASYWQQKWQRFRRINWKNPQLSDFRGIFRFALKGMLLLLLAFTFFYLVVYTGLVGGDMPSRNELKAIQNNTASEVYSADQVLLGRYYIQDRTNIGYDEIAPVAIQALIATEDARFYDHAGIDMRSMLRVFFKSLLLQQESSGGGSTLSQQLAKNLFPRKGRRLWDMPVNKMREIIIARKLEGLYSKQELLELYLNTVPMGGNLYGIERASRRFFNTTADSLKTQEAAVLIGMLKATTTYNPRLNPERALQRRNVVLAQMAKYNYLTPNQADSLRQTPLVLNYRYTTHNDGMAPYFREQLRQELVTWAASQRKKNGQPYNLYTDGLKIYTTIDSRMQRHAEQAVRKKMALLQKQFDTHWRGRTPWGRDATVIEHAMHRSDRFKKLKAAGATDAEAAESFRKPIQMSVFSWSGNTNRTMSPLDSLAYYQRFLNTGLLAMEPATGYVRAWVGGIDHHAFKYDHVRSRRQVGSTFKPFVYAAALEKGLAPCSYFANEQAVYPEYDNWSPRNANEQYGGEYTMRGALAHSVNTISAHMIMEAGVDRTVALAKRIGIEQDLPKVPSLALGTADLSLFEMVSAYATFANGGLRAAPVYVARIEDRNGLVIRQHREGNYARRVLSRENAAIMLHLLQGVVEEGSAAKLRSEYGLRMDIAGKTGTTQDHADGWFIGITPHLVTGVWVGAESPKVRFRTLTEGQGSRTALPVWGEFMSRVAKDREYAGFRSSRFAPLSPNLLNVLDCESFREEPPKPENLFDRLFQGVTKSYKDWKNQSKRGRQQKNAEKRKRQQEKAKKKGRWFN
ncbi:transglycosylase domain-containing protein [Pontibacter sp. JH31]|uniref:Transglycosylase domain-containing protein n=1 Tax=Pontibacter aquaedesilientis TaxID=2766980 RepID=A0ABR7XDM2_9BACT|nr:transglycosylase domain-containing protein [Pontibacter aquaedesilientis]MBD1396392.1 transglycosylase domain-containing protein [Pontibacter aquaedesilientis]